MITTSHSILFATASEILPTTHIMLMILKNTNKNSPNKTWLVCVLHWWCSNKDREKTRQVLLGLLLGVLVINVQSIDGAKWPKTVEQGIKASNSQGQSLFNIEIQEHQVLIHGHLSNICYGYLNFKFHPCLCVLSKQLCHCQVLANNHAVRRITSDPYERLCVSKSSLLIFRVCLVGSCEGGRGRTPFRM